MKRPSGSSMHLLLACPASHALPQVNTDGEAAKKGRSAHEEMERLVKAHAEIPGLLGQAQDYATEISIAYDVEADRARVIGTSLGRDYGTLKESEIPMTLDVLAYTDDSVIVGDWKFKRSYEVPARNHAQLRLGALAACRVSGKKKALAWWSKFNPDKLPDLEVTYHDRAELGTFELDVIADEVRDAWKAWRRAIRDVEAGRSPNVHESESCRWCPARKSCHAKTALVRAAVGAPNSFVEQLRDLAPEQVGEAYVRANAAMSMLHALKAEIEALARENPVHLPDGRVLQLVEGKMMERVVEPRLVAEYLAERFGPDLALQACDLDASKASIERALKAAGHSISLKAVLSDLRERGAIQKKQGEPKVAAVEPKKEIEAA